MDEFTLDFGPDPLSESEDESLDPFPLPMTKRTEPLSRWFC